MKFNKEILMQITNQLNFDDLQPLFEKYEINTTNRAAGFLAQCSHESSGFKVLQENLNYSAAALLKVFPKYFKTMEEAEMYAGKPKKIANKVYANRMGNGSEESGDGYKYRGRGCIQLTGKDNYRKFAEISGLGLEETLTYCISPKGAVESALYYWKSRNINTYCDKDDIKGMTKAVNGGYNGLKDREKKYNEYKHILGD